MTDDLGKSPDDVHSVSGPMKSLIMHKSQSIAFLHKKKRWLSVSSQEMMLESF